MAQQFYRGAYGDDSFGFEVVGRCTFEDMGFLVTGLTLRLNPAALNQCIFDEIGGQRGDWKLRVYDLLGAPIDDDHSAYVAHVLSEICIVVTMERIYNNAVG